MYVLSFVFSESVQFNEKQVVGVPAPSVSRQLEGLALWLIVFDMLLLTVRLYFFF